jgi:hypothetical protein
MGKGLKIGFAFIPLPQEIFTTDDVPTRGELLLLAYLSLHQTRFGRAIMPLSDDELLKGKRRQDDSRADKGCGIKGANNLKDARSRLEARGWIETWKDGRNRFYRIVLAREEIIAEVPEQLSELDSNCPKYTPQLSKIDSTTVQNGQRNKEYKNTSKKESKKTPSAKADERFTPVQEFIKRCCEHAKVPLVWDGAEGKQLSAWLKAAPTVPLEEVKELVRNRFRSRDDPPGRRPCKWIPYLGDYASGPLDRFNKREGDGKQDNSTEEAKRILGLAD